MLDLKQFMITTIINCQMFSYIELYKDLIFYRMTKYNLLLPI